MAKSLTFAEAKRLSVLKWQYIWDNQAKIYRDYNNRISWLEHLREELREVHSELKDITNACGFCEYYKCSCNKCCIGEPYACGCDKHPWKKWYDDPSPRNTLVMLELIKNAEDNMTESITKDNLQNALDELEEIDNDVICKEGKVAIRKILCKLVGKEVPEEVKEVKAEKIDFSKFTLRSHPSCLNLIYHGEDEPWSILSIMDDGTFHRYANIKNNIGFQLDDDGRIEEDGEDD